MDLYTLNFICAHGGLALLALTLGLFVDYFFFQSKYYLRYCQDWVWPILTLTLVGSIALTLVYSEYFGFVPCSLCWLQRIALYPQALFVIMALKTKESIYFPLYAAALSVFGFAAAIYQNVLQMTPKEATSNFVLPCLADGSADCAERIMNVYGFVTFPLLSAITFLFLIVVYLNLRRASK
jgi:disulfide bond formation protein DsbB